jgi:kynurenine formamidase
VGRQTDEPARCQTRIQRGCGFLHVSDHNAEGTKNRDQSRNIVDLTYDFDATTVYWPNAKSFDWQKEYWDMSARGYWYAAGHYSASEHGGTPIDAPIHFSRDGTTVDQIALKTRLSPAVVIDVSDARAKN